jgi:hypothetical protein
MTLRNSIDPMKVLLYTLWIVNGRISFIRAIYKKSPHAEYRHNIMAVEEDGATFLVYGSRKMYQKWFHKEEKGGDFRAVDNYFHADPDTSKQPWNLCSVLVWRCWVHLFICGP